MTKNLKWYLMFSVVWSLAFFTVLDWGIADPQSSRPYVLGAAIAYGLGFALVGHLLGRPDDQAAVRYDLRSAYAAVSSLVSAAIGTLWILFFQPSAIRGIPVYLAAIAALWVIGAIHAKRSIKGTSAKELFQ